MAIKLRTKKVGRYYRLQKLINNVVVSEIDHNFINQLSAHIYGARINNPFLSNYIPKNERPYNWTA